MRNLWGSDGTVGSNLTIVADSMTNTTLKDSDKSSHESKGISVTISKGKEEQPMTTEEKLIF